MLDELTTRWLVLGGSALLIGISKTGLPGVGIIAILMAAMVIPAKESTGLILPMLIVGDIFAVAYYRRHAVWKHLLKLLPFSVTGVVLGTVGLGYVTNEQLRPIIGGIVLVMLVLNYLHHRRPDAKIPDGWWFPIVMGLIGGTTTMMANAAGPIMVIYLLAMRLPRNEFLGTGAWYFLLMNCFKVPFSMGLSLITFDSLKMNLTLAPLVVLGAIVGVRLAKRIPEKGFGRIVQILALVAAIELIVRHPR